VSYTVLASEHRDIDLVCAIPGVGGPENKLQQTRFLREVSNLLRQSRLGTDIIVIGKARVPIIKFTSVQGGFKIDISVNMTNSIRVYPKVLQLFDQVGEEAARSLIMVTKAFLNQRNMNEVHSGGLGSYSIICLVVSFLQVCARAPTCVSG
jgi:DNA polymerase sigma